MSKAKLAKTDEELEFAVAMVGVVSVMEVA